MSRRSQSAMLVIVSLFFAATASCQRGPAAVKQPTIDASSAGKLAMEQYDKNGDGKVADDELEKAPGLKAALSRMDTDGDKAISADEVTARVKVWQGMQISVTSFAFTVTMDGSPLPDVNVTFEPEGFLGNEIKAAVATTNQTGSGRASIPKDQRPDPTWPSGTELGLYRVIISKIVNGKETIPAKYNTNTTLGQEVAFDVPEITNNRVVYVLTSK